MEAVPRQSVRRTEVQGGSCCSDCDERSAGGRENQGAFYFDETQYAWKTCVKGKANCFCLSLLSGGIAIVGDLGACFFNRPSATKS